MASWKGHCTKEYRNSILRNSEKVLYTVNKERGEEWRKWFSIRPGGKELWRWALQVREFCLQVKYDASDIRLVDKLSSMRSWWLFVLLINWDLWVSNQVDQLYQVGFLRNLGTMPSPERFIECSRLIWHFEQAFRHVLFQNFQLLFQGMSMVEWVKAQARHSHIIDHLTVLYDSSIFVHITEP